MKATTLAKLERRFRPFITLLPPKIATSIYLKYILRGAACQLNISERLRDELKKEIFEKKNFSMDLFANIVLEVETTIKTDLFPRFLDSP